MTSQSWIWQRTEWPKFNWNDGDVASLHEQVGALWSSTLSALLPLEQRAQQELSLEAMARNLLQTNAIEGEVLDRDSVRSSLIVRLHGSEATRTMGADPAHDALAALMDEATQALDGVLTANTLQRWHSMLPPPQLHRDFERGSWRSGEYPMQVVSGSPGRLTIHYEAPPSSAVPAHMAEFLAAFTRRSVDPALTPWVRAALAHFHLVTIHPWEDGNGRMARLVADRALADSSPHMARSLALAASIQAHRSEYYEVLEHCQRGGLDITAWLQFHARMVLDSLKRLQDGIRRVVSRARFWQRHAATHLRPEQRKLLLRMWSDRDDRFDDGIDANRYGRLCGVSKPTATRHLSELADAGVLARTGAGRTTRYVLVVEPAEVAGEEYGAG
jgi:Fic family protein